MEEGYCIIKVLFDGNNKAVDYRFLEVNPAFERQSGMHGVVGKRVRERYPDLEQHWFDAYGKVALTGTPVRFADKAKAIGNRWFEINAFRIGAPGGHKVAIIFNNITERRRVDAERERLDQILQDKNAELELAIRVADKANLAKSEFLSSMSHELRTPLSAILGFAQLIESGTPAPTPSQARSLEQILRSGWYLLELINEILDLALIESGKMALSLEPIALDDILLECGAMVETQAAKREICVTLPTLDRTQIVVADGKRLKQVLINLLANAIKYNRSGGEVSVRCDAPSEGRVRISVSDTGAGIDANQLTQLFQPFNRLGRESTAEEGTGIGLVVCKRLIELMGGSIGVDSRVGEGSVFWIELALSAQRAHAPATPGTFAVALPRNDQSLRTLLHIEDNPVNQLLVEELVARRDDLRLLTASDGRSGYELAVAAQPDVILLDINLPGISGVETLKLLAAHPRTAGIPVVAISANAMPHDIQRGLAAGFFRYLTKPIVIAEFMHTMDLALQFATLHPVRALTEEPQ
jgi:signal transduction histidine kinase/CheY-like chemotaxis protein